MKRKDRRRQMNQPGSDAQKTSDQTSSKDSRNRETSIVGDVIVSGEISVEPGPRAALARRTEQESNELAQGKQLYWARATFWIVTFYAILTFWQGCESHNLVVISRKTYEASNRPYVGEAGTVFIRDEEPNKAQNGGKTVDPPDGARLSISMKNYGSAPARKFMPLLDLKVDGKSLEVPYTKQTTTTLFPAEITSMSAIIYEGQYRRIMDGSLILQYNLTVTYEGVDGTLYSDCERHQFDPSAGFYNLGGICNKPWTNGFINGRAF